MRFTLAALLPTILVLAGCGGGYDDPLNQSQRKTNPSAFGVATDPPEAADPDPEGQTDGEAPGKKPKEVVREEAKVGVGEKGSGYGGGFITTPVSTYFRAQEKIIFTVQIPHEVQLYKAMNGKAPQSFEEFTEKILNPARIDLPTLPNGHKYIWNAEEEKLFVEHPKE